MSADINAILDSTEDYLKLATTARSFMYSGQNIGTDMDLDAFKESAPCLIAIIPRKNADVKRYALEGLLTMARTNIEALDDIENLIKAAFDELNIRNEFVTEI